MSEEAQLLKKVFALTASELEGRAVSVRPDFARIKSYSWSRITRMSSFWRSEKPNQSLIPLDLYVADFVAGLAGVGTGWAYLLLGYPGHMECWIGAQPASLGPNGLRECLRGAFPDIRCTNLGTPRFDAIEALPFGVAFSGTPTLKRDQQSRESRADQIEKVCRTLYGAPWAYMVTAESHPASDTIQTINRTTAEIRNIHATYLLKQNSVDENNKTAQRYVELLEKKLQRWDLGRVTGMWNYQGWLFVGDKLRLNRGAAVLHSAMSGKDSLPDPFRIHYIAPDGLAQLNLAPLNSLEMACLTCPPSEEYSGFEIIPPVRFGVETNQSFKPDEDLVCVGAIMDRGETVGTDLRIRRSDLTKHGIIVGVTGAGKTNTCFSLLEQVWNDGKGVPFMVIESAKSEYRALLKNPRFKGLRVFTVGDERISPIRLNPFQVPKGILIQSHIDYLQALFGAAFVLYPPMPYVLAMSIQRVYEEKGWDLTRNSNRRGENSASSFPTLDDLIATVGRVSDGMGYEGEIRSNIKAGLEGRLNQLRIGGGKGVMLNCNESMSDEDLFGAPCILELKQLVSDEEKAFLIGLLLIRLYEHYESKGVSGDGTLKHVTLIEEAHRLLKNVSTQQGGESANPQGKAIEVFANLLAEIRAFGEGIFMAEQIPTKLAPEALKNTNLKLIQRLVAKDDREAVGSTMNLSEEQMSALSTLQAGQAVTYLEGMEKPVLIKIPLSKTKAEYEQITMSEISERMAPFWKDRACLLRKFEGCEACPAAPGEGSCGRLSGNKPAPALDRAARRLMAAYLFLPPSAAAAKSVFLRYFGEAFPKQARNPYCYWTEFVQTRMSEWGMFADWPHADTEAIIRQLSATYREVSSAVPAKSIAPGFPQQAGPFVGCRRCPAPCHYQFPISGLMDGKAMDQFFQLYKEGDGAADYSRQLVSSLFQSPSGEEPAIRQHAYCFVVQNLSRSGLPEASQFSACEKLAQKLIP
jgi:DNA helicase HerA-like ATPase